MAAAVTTAAAVAVAAERDGAAERKRDERRKEGGKEQRTWDGVGRKATRSGIKQQQQPCPADAAAGVESAAQRVRREDVQHEGRLWGMAAVYKRSDGSKQALLSTRAWRGGGAPQLSATRWAKHCLIKGACACFDVHGSFRGRGEAKGAVRLYGTGLFEL
jgi:hypothetical protein